MPNGEERGKDRQRIDNEKIERHIPDSIQEDFEKKSNVIKPPVNDPPLPPPRDQDD